MLSEYSYILLHQTVVYRHFSNYNYLKSSTCFIIKIQIYISKNVKFLHHIIANHNEDSNSIQCRVFVD